MSLSKLLRLWRVVRKLGVPEAGAWLAERHEGAIVYRLREEGVELTEEVRRIAKLGAQGLVEGMF